MDSKTRAALEKSIAKWEKNARAEAPKDFKITPQECPLCSLFYFRKDCEGCPVYSKTLERNCSYTPYNAAVSRRYDWSTAYASLGAEGAKLERDRAHAAAREEVAFLRSLLSEDAV